ncbi:MAG TPA: PadR family transcriptional regulator [Chloroflexota bacterium]|nr:PadR family transcriptional regulator [Chloroflexota bacterium]
MGRQWFGGEAPRARRFEKGDLKYVILDLIAEKPRHGYEIIRALEERFGGLYTPSPGAVYPTLQLLEDLGHVTAQQWDGKRVYAITAEGREFLAEREQVLTDIRSRVGTWLDPSFRGEVQATMHELRDLARLLGRGARGRHLDAERLRRVREVLARTRAELAAILDEGGTR